MKNSLVTLLEKVLHRQNELRPVKTDAAMFQFETYNIVLELIREQILLDELPIVNAPYTQHEQLESIETAVTTNNTEKEITWLEMANTAPNGLGYSNSLAEKLERGVKVKASFKELIDNKFSAEVLPTGVVRFTASGSWK